MQRRITRRPSAVAAAFIGLAALVGGGATSAQASPAPAGVTAHAPSGDGSQPLPGYTIHNPSLAPLTAGGQPTTVTQGVYRHAAFDLEVPAHWNGQLVMWAHGYRGEGTVLTVDPPAYGLRQTLVDEGYAWAASSYTDNSYDPGAGVVSTHDLAGHVADLLRQRPSRTYILGVSMGGHVIARSLEQYPFFYAGAMPMCGVLGGDTLFDFFLGYNLVAQDLAGVQDYPPPANYLTADVPGIERTLGIAGLPLGQSPMNALGKQLQAITVQRSGGPRPGADASFSYWKDFLFALYQPDDGGSLAQNPIRVAQNLTTTYTPDSPVDVNATVQRVAAPDRRDRMRHSLTQIPLINGTPHVPVLSLHGLGDMFVPFSMEQVYAREVAQHHESQMLVQRAIRETGHCEYTPTEVGRAWQDLQTWVQAKGPAARAAARPAGDDVTDPKAVKSPTFGCAFTDQSAYADPADFPTRAFFPPCPRGSSRSG